MTIKELKKLSKEEFLKLPRTTEEIYNSLQNSKAGWINARRKGDGAGEKGITEAFGEGLPVWISNPNGNWWTTSNIQSIDWENHTFKTLNSTYDFEFKPFEQIAKEREEFHKHLNDEKNNNQ